MCLGIFNVHSDLAVPSLVVPLAGNARGADRPIAGPSPFLATRKSNHLLDGMRVAFVSPSSGADADVVGGCSLRGRPLELEPLRDDELEAGREADVSMAVCSTSPSPCAAWPSPTSKRAPGRVHGNEQRSPRLRRLVVEISFVDHGGFLLMRPAVRRVTPMLPKTARAATRCQGRMSRHPLRQRDDGPPRRMTFFRRNPLQPLLRIEIARLDRDGSDS